jgi:hypothetical protein
MQYHRELARDGNLGLAEPMPQDFSANHFGTRVNSTPAALNR